MEVWSHNNVILSKTYIPSIRKKRQQTHTRIVVPLPAAAASPRIHDLQLSLPNIQLEENEAPPP